MGQNQRFIAFIILFLMIFMQIGTDLYLPSFPAIRNQLHTTNSMVQHTFSIFLLGFAISQLVYGTLSDRYGRRPILIIGLAIYFLMCFFCMTAQSITELLIARGMQGLGAGACTAMSRAVMRDKFSGKAFDRMVVYQTLTWSFVPITAPLLGSYIQHYLGWRYNFGFLFVLSFAGLIMAFIFQESIQNKEKQLDIKKILSDFKSILTHDQFYPPLICTMGAIGAIVGFNVTAPLILQDTLKLSAIEYGWSVFFVALCFLFGTLLNRYLMKKYPNMTIAGFGLGGIGGCVLLLFIFSLFQTFDLGMVLFPIMLLQFGLALVFPVYAARASHLFPEKAGKTAAVMGCALFLGGSLTSAILSELPEDTLTPLMSVLLGLFLIMTFFHSKILRSEAS